MFYKFQDFSIISSLKSDPNTIWCSYQNCDGYGSKNDLNELGNPYCKLCRLEFCSTCFLFNHFPKSCAEMRAERSPEDLK